MDSAEEAEQRRALSQQSMLLGRQQEELEAKLNFIKVQILENKEDPKSLWKVLNRFQSIGKSKCSVSKVGLDIDGMIEFDKK